MPPNAMYVWVVPTSRQCAAQSAQCVGPVALKFNAVTGHFRGTGLGLRSDCTFDPYFCHYRGRSFVPVGSRVGGLL